jgi:hypothetical protein
MFEGEVRRRQNRERDTPGPPFTSSYVELLVPRDSPLVSAQVRKGGTFVLYLHDMRGNESYAAQGQRVGTCQLHQQEGS